MGTDELGRDTLARIIHGAQVSLQVGAISVGIAFVLGVSLGLLSGFFGGKVDSLLMRFVDMMFALPGLVLAIVIAGLLGPNRRNAMIAIGIVITPAFARVVRGSVLEVMGFPFVESARALGASHKRIMVRNVLPNIAAPLIVLVTVYLSTAILSEAALSFLGLGTQPPEASWGGMLNSARSYLDADPWLSIFPGLAIAIVVLGFNFLGDGLRDILDPRLGPHVGGADDQEVAPRCRLLIRNGWVADGAGSPPFLGDVAIEGGKIVEVGRLGEGADRDPGDRRDGQGGVPGLRRPAQPQRLLAAREPDRGEHHPPGRDDRGRRQLRLELRADLGPLARVHERPAPHVRLRRPGDPVDDVRRAPRLPRRRRAQPRTSRGSSATTRSGSRPASPARIPTELQSALMDRFMREAMEAGALGMSTGLEFNPGREATTAELVRLNAIAGEYDGIYTSHVRNRDSGILHAIAEFLEVARAGGIRAEISHLNVRHNTNAPDRGWERAVEMMEAAREEGMDVLADTTPFVDGLGQLSGILPPWVAAEGKEQALAYLRDPETRKRLRTECDRYWRFIHKGEWDRVRLQASEQHPEWDGLTFAQIADLRKADPWDCYFDVLADAGDTYESILVVGRLFTDEHMAEMISHPLFCLGVDTFTVTEEGPLADVLRHPLGYSGHVHYLTHHVRRTGRSGSRRRSAR